jgi:hypothetical protein
MGKRKYVEILSVRTPAGVKNNYQDIVGMVLPTTGNAYHGVRVVTPNGTERDIFHYNVGKATPKEENTLMNDKDPVMVDLDRYLTELEEDYVDPADAARERVEYLADQED